MNKFIGWEDQDQISRQVSALRDRRQELAGLRTAIVYGGISAEDRLYISRCPVEQKTITALVRTFSKLNIPAVIVDPSEPAFLRKLVDFDLVMPSMHGPFGEDGRLQGTLDYLRKPYCGSGVAASAIAADKALCKLAMAGLAVPTPPWHLADADCNAFEGKAKQAMVKPRMGGSSVGMSLVSNKQELDEAITTATAIDPIGALIEEFMLGLPVTVALLDLPSGVLVLPPLAVQPQASRFNDAETKLDAAGERTILYGRADLDKPTLDQLRQHSIRLWNGLGCRGFARIDFVVTEDGVFALEVNTIPGLSTESNFALAAYESGLELSDVLLALISEALSRKNPDVPLPVVTVADLGTVQETRHLTD